MAKAKVVLNHAGFRELLRSQEVLDKLIAPAVEKIQGAAGPGMSGEAFIGRNRVVGSVWTSTREGREREARSRALTRAVGSAAGQ